MDHPRITYRPIDFESDADCELLAKWTNDPSIRHLVAPAQNQDDYTKLETVESIRLQYKCRGHSRYLADLMILLDGKAVGTANILIDAIHGIVPGKNVSWYGIVIGEATARGRGIGKHAIKHLEEISLKNHSTVAEIGTFEFNQAGIALFKSLGYQEIKRLPDFTYWNGRLWDDVRMKKNLLR